MSQNPASQPAAESGFDNLNEAAYAAGVAAADRILALHKDVAPAGPPRGLLVAEGDSWFDYPFHDVLSCLEDLNWKVVSVAHAGDTVESMAYDQTQLTRLERELRRLADRGETPKAILLSGGGNDIAGPELSTLLNHKESNLPPLNEKVMSGILDERLAVAIVSFAAGITRLSEELFGHRLPILIHGYSHPVPDGRGVLGGLGFLPGPWLLPSFRRKGYEGKNQSGVQEMVNLMKVLIDRFNSVLERIAGSPQLEHVTYVDVRGALSPTLPDTYKTDWANELHPTKEAFTRVAGLIDDVLATLPLA